MFTLTRKSATIALVTAVILGACTGAVEQADDTPTTTASPTGTAADTPTATETGPTEEVTLVFSDWHMAEEVWGASLEEAMARFEEANPNITIEPSVVSYAEKETQYATQIEAGEGPDVFHLAGSILPFASRDLLQPLDDFVAQEGDGFTDTWYPQVIEQLTVDGSLMALPGDFMPMTMFYNSAMLEEAGRDSENLPATWAEWMEYANALNDPDNGLWAFGTIGAVSPGWILRGGPVFFSHGADLFNEDGTCSALHTPEALEAFETLAGLVRDGFVPPGVTDQNAGTVREQMANEQIAMAFGSGWTPPIVDALNPDLNAFETLVTAPVPTAEGTDPEQPTIAWLSWWAMNPNTDNPEAAWEFMKFLTSQETEQNFFDDNRVLSSRIDVSGAREGEGPEGYPELVNDKFASVLAGEIPNARFIPKIPDVNRAIEIVNTAAQEAFTGSDDPAVYLEQAHQQVNDLLGGSDCPSF